MPVHLRLITDRFRGLPPDAKTARPPAATLPAPRFLDREARREWRRVAPALFKLGLLTELDRGPLAAYCQAFSTFIQARDAIKRMAALDPVFSRADGQNG